MKKSLTKIVGDIFTIPAILTVCLLMIPFIAACKPSGSSPDNINPIPIIELTTDDLLQTWKDRAIIYFDTPDIKIGWHNLNKTPHPDGLIWGTFFGVIPNEQSYIALDNVLKSYDNDNLYNIIYVIGHEVCHYKQWINGARFTLAHIRWHERWYEQECIMHGNMFLNSVISESIK